MKNRRPRPSVLILGYGNPGRGDDGLGPAIAAELEPLRRPELTVDSDYQLTVEDALAASQHAVTVFVDADVSAAAPFEYRRLAVGASAGGFSSHGVEPVEVAGLARELFGATTEFFVLGVRGYAFEMMHEGLSPAARDHMRRALDFLLERIEKGDWAEAADAVVGRGAPVPAVK
jgi:hydrogenase maturation protease